MQARANIAAFGLKSKHSLDEDTQSGQMTIKDVDQMIHIDRLS